MTGNGIGNLAPDITGSLSKPWDDNNNDNEMDNLDYEDEPFCDDCHYLQLFDDELLELDDDSDYKFQNLVLKDIGEHVSLKDAQDVYVENNVITIFVYKFGEFRALDDNETKEYLNSLKNRRDE